MILWLAACLTESNFPDRAAAELCARYEECDRGSFENQYADQDACVADIGPPLGDYYSCLSGECTFDAGNAQTCLTTYRTLSCGEVSSGELPPECEDVYPGCDGTDVGLCALDAMF